MVKIKIACKTEEYDEGDEYKVNYEPLNKVSVQKWLEIVDDWKIKYKDNILENC